MRNKLIITILILTAVVGIFLIYRLSNSLLEDSKTKDQNPAVDTTPIIPMYKEVKPGESNRNDVVEKLGDPVSETQRSIYDILEFESNNPNFNDEVYIENEEAIFIKQIVVKEDNIDADSIRQKYYTAEYVLYGSDSLIGINLYAFPESGVAFIGHGKSGIVFEIWYFEPMTYEKFKDKFAQEYTEQLEPQPDIIH